VTATSEAALDIVYCANTVFFQNGDNCIGACQPQLYSFPTFALSSRHSSPRRLSSPQLDQDDCNTVTQITKMGTH
jgi:hypothetical protein